MAEDWWATREAFARAFGAAPEVAVRAPGRANLIGDHTDYHEGFVLPMALDRAMVLHGRRNPDRRIRVYSRAFGAGVEIDLDSEERHPEPWASYFQAVGRVLSARHPVTFGCDVVVDSDIPVGGGLSSSAALLVGFSALLAHLHEVPLDSLKLALLAREAAYWYGTRGGIMDQFVISHARADRAILLDCRSLHHRYLPMPEGAAIVVANTGVRRDVIDTPFAPRRREAEAGLRVLQARLGGLRALRDVEPAVLWRHESDLRAADPTGVLWRRCKHVVTENARVLAAAAALASGELTTVGTLMTQSHASLRDDYEASCPELDALVGAAGASPGCLGARMTGGGFGGCTVNLVASEAVEAFCRSLADRYRGATGIEPAVFPARASVGLRVVELG